MNHIAENALIAGALLSVFILPVAILTRRSKQKRLDGLHQNLQTIASERKMALTRREFLDNRIIGWSESANTLFQVSPEGFTINDLDKASRCYVLKNINGNAVKSVLLQIVDPANKPLYSISFYQQFLDNEQKLKQLEAQARDWEQMLTKHFQK